MQSSKPTTPGQRIRAIREAKGLSQMVAAGRAGISQTMWSALERDAATVSIRRAQSVAAALGATTDEIWPPAKSEAA